MPPVYNLNGAQQCGLNAIAHATRGKPLADRNTAGARMRRVPTATAGILRSNKSAEEGSGTETASASTAMPVAGMVMSSKAAHIVTEDFLALRCP